MARLLGGRCPSFWHEWADRSISELFWSIQGHFKVIDVLPLPTYEFLSVISLTKALSCKTIFERI